MRDVRYRDISEDETKIVSSSIQLRECMILKGNTSLRDTESPQTILVCEPPLSFFLDRIKINMCLIRPIIRIYDKTI